MGVQVVMYPALSVNSMAVFLASDEDEQVFASSCFAKLFVLAGFAVNLAWSFFGEFPYTHSGVGTICLLPLFILHNLCSRGRKFMMNVPVIGIALTRWGTEGLGLRCGVIAVALFAVFVALFAVGGE